MSSTGSSYGTIDYRNVDCPYLMLADILDKSPPALLTTNKQQ